MEYRIIDRQKEQRTHHSDKAFVPGAAVEQRHRPAQQNSQPHRDPRQRQCYRQRRQQGSAGAGCRQRIADHRGHPRQQQINQAGQVHPAAAHRKNSARRDGQRQQLLRSTNEDAQWLIRIVENLLSITRISSEEAKVKKEPEPAEEVIESAVAKTHKHYPEVDIRVHLPDELMMVPMDPLLMEQVLVNLMENAVIHGETHHIDVTLSSEGNCAVFTVADDGRGIPQHLLPRLFDGSARSDRSSDGKRSMGIGLSVCRTIVLAHGGVIRGDNRQEGGAVFTVTLPMKGENDED